ncbi:uncharacterized protein LOC143765017 [Ranitomeya variabilis]|uniref:uncharacterized protein LOC143765017 n=1 Tax=Ranitomeya variabilis TaxID=490064 RepID=UPI0040578EC8
MCFFLYSFISVGDVRKRWRSVTDRFIKSLKTPSGSSPSRKRVPFAEQLQFILGSRSLRRTESNVYAQTPPDLEGDTSEDNIGENVEECTMVSQDSPGNMSLSGRSQDLTDTFGEIDSPANTGKVLDSNNASTSSVAASNSGGGVSRRMGMGAAFARSVALRRAAPKKSKQAQVIENLTSRTLNLLENSDKQDEHDKFGSLLADRLRTLPRDKQQIYMTAANCLLTAIDGTPTLPPAQQVMMGIFKIFNNPIVPPPPAAASQRYGQAAIHRPDHVDAYSYGHTPVPTAIGHRTSTPNTSLSSQHDLFPGYGYEPEYYHC